ncbi:MAG: hypothetical protein QUS13_09975 [Smithella sp.]|nr:hypothetical protein [Smithella sp.]
MSFPHTTADYYIEFKIPKIKRRWSISMPVFNSSNLALESGHQWEIGANNIQDEDIMAVIKTIGWKVEKHYRCPEYRYHHYFIIVPQ